MLVGFVGGECECEDEDEADESDRRNGRFARMLHNRFDEAEGMSLEISINPVEIQGDMSI